MEAPPNEYLRSLGALLSTTSPSKRQRQIQTLSSILPSTTSNQRPLIISLTTQTISQLFTNDHINQPTPWSKHANYTEPLLESILNLLSETFSQPPRIPLPALPTLHDQLFELSISTVDYITIYPPPHPDLTSVTTAFENASKSLTLATAHLLNLLTDLAKEKSITIQILSYHTLAALTRLLPSHNTAAFLPGLISTLTKALSKATTLNSTVSIAALDALHVILSTLNLPSEQKDHVTSIPQHHHDHTPGKPRLSITRDSQWIQSTANQVVPRITHLLSSSTGPLHHTSPRARQYLINFVKPLFHSTALSDLTYRAFLTMSLFFLAGDDFQSVRETALIQLKLLHNTAHITLHQIQSGVRAVLSVRGFNALQWQSAETVKQLRNDEEQALKALSGKSPCVWTRVATGYLNAFIPPPDHHASVIPSSQLASSLAIIGPDAFCRILTELLSEQWTVTEDSAQAFDTALNCLVLRAAASLGHSGQLASIFSTLVERALLHDIEDHDEAHLQRFRERAYAVLVLQAVVRGEIRNERTRDSHVYQRLVYECTKETLQLMSWFFLPNTDMLTSRTVDDDMISLKHCLLVCTARLFEDLANLHRNAKIRPLGADITLVILMSLLRDVSNGEISVRRTARETITRISLAIGWKNDRKLLFRHLNYIIGRVIRNLEKKWAGDILRFVIGNQGDDVSHEATVLLETTFQRMNESLAGASDETALTTMNSIINILSTAVAQKEPQDQHSHTLKRQNFTGSAAEEVLYQNDLSDLRRSLFTYCTEDIPNYDKLTAKVEFLNKSFLEDDASDDETNRDAFETIAEHALEATRDILVGRPWKVCAASLLCATLSAKLLEGRRRILLPFAAKILPLLPDQFVALNEELTSGEQMLRDFRRRKFGGLDSGDNVEDLVMFLNSKGQELPVVTNACLLLAAFAAYAGSFIRDRFVRLIYPKMRPLLRLAQCFPTLLVPAHAIKSTHRVTSPSYGAMSACDACLEAIASVALVAPDVLAPFANSLVEYIAVFFNPKFDPVTSPKRQVAHTNRSMARFECERWTKRSEFAGTIVKQLKIVNASDVLTTFLKCDDTAPNVIKPIHDSLYAVTVRRSPSRIGHGRSR